MSAHCPTPMVYPNSQIHIIVLVDVNEFSKVQHSHSRHQKTTSNLLKITLKDRLWVSNE